MDNSETVAHSLSEIEEEEELDEGQTPQEKESEPEDLDDIHRAAKEGNLERLRELIEEGADVNADSPEGWPPLHTAITNKNFECAALLIKNGAKDFFERQKEEYMTRLLVSNRRRRNSDHFLHIQRRQMNREGAFAFTPRQIKES